MTPLLAPFLAPLLGPFAGSLVKALILLCGISIFMNKYQTRNLQTLFSLMQTPDNRYFLRDQFAELEREITMVGITCQLLIAKLFITLHPTIPNGPSMASFP